jgi:tellurite resistance protein TehA-like permease
MTICFDQWPLASNIQNGVKDFFGYLTFSVSWSGNTFAFVMMILSTVFLLSSIACIVESAQAGQTVLEIIVACALPLLTSDAY